MARARNRQSLEAGHVVAAGAARAHVEVVPVHTRAVVRADLEVERVGAALRHDRIGHLGPVRRRRKVRVRAQVVPGNLPARRPRGPDAGIARAGWLLIVEADLVFRGAVAGDRHLLHQVAGGRGRTTDVVGAFLRIGGHHRVLRFMRVPIRKIARFETGVAHLVAAARAAEGLVGADVEQIAGGVGDGGPGGGEVGQVGGAGVKPGRLAEAVGRLGVARRRAAGQVVHAGVRTLVFVHRQQIDRVGVQARHREAGARAVIDDLAVETLVGRRGEIVVHAAGRGSVRRHPARGHAAHGVEVGHLRRSQRIVQNHRFADQAVVVELVGIGIRAKAQFGVGGRRAAGISGRTLVIAIDIEGAPAAVAGDHNVNPLVQRRAISCIPAPLGRPIAPIEIQIATGQGKQEETIIIISPRAGKRGDGGLGMPVDPHGDGDIR